MAPTSLAATVVHVLAERGAIDYDAPIAELWPAFAAHGKQGATVMHAPTHSVGVPGLPGDLTPDAFLDSGPSACGRPVRPPCRAPTPCCTSR